MNDGAWFSQEELKDLDQQAEETDQLIENLRANIRDAWSLIESLEWTINNVGPGYDVSRDIKVGTWCDAAAVLLGEEVRDDD